MLEGDYTRYTIHLTSTFVTLFKSHHHWPPIPLTLPACTAPASTAHFTPQCCHGIYSHVLLFDKYALVLTPAVFDILDWGILEKINELVVPGDFSGLRLNWHIAAGG